MFSTWNDGFSTIYLVYLLTGCSGCCRCGLNQSGSGYNFNGISIPDGIMGLGDLNISVPNTLANANMIQNSFSMCFDNTSDGSGRLVFGDRGSSMAANTNMLSIATEPYVPYKLSSFINVDGVKNMT